MRKLKEHVFIELRGGRGPCCILHEYHLISRW
jgi:hypothetical protein